MLPFTDAVFHGDVAVTDNSNEYHTPYDALLILCASYADAIV